MLFNEYVLLRSEFQAANGWDTFMMIDHLIKKTRTIKPNTSQRENICGMIYVTKHVWK